MRNVQAPPVAATAAIIAQVLPPTQDDLRGKRDRALILVGFAGALRRSELPSIRVGGEPAASSHPDTMCRPTASTRDNPPTTPPAP